jgi:DNA-binding NtrC family response regulator
MAGRQFPARCTLALVLHTDLQTIEQLEKTMVNESSRTSAHWEPRISDAVQKMAASGCPVLVIGERGVGKAWVAELLHALSPRRAAPQKRVRGPR